MRDSVGVTVSVLILTAQLPDASPDLNGSSAARFVPEVMTDFQLGPIDGAGLEVTVVYKVKQGISQARDLHRARRNARIGASGARARNADELKVKLLAAFDRRHPDGAGDLAVKRDLGLHLNLLLVGWCNVGYESGLFFAAETEKGGIGCRPSSRFRVVCR
jgi:hypothetical protein